MKIGTKQSCEFEYPVRGVTSQLINRDTPPQTIHGSSMHSIVPYTHVLCVCMQYYSTTLIVCMASAKPPVPHSNLCMMAFNKKYLCRTASHKMIIPKLSTFLMSPQSICSTINTNFTTIPNYQHFSEMLITILVTLVKLIQLVMLVPQVDCIDMRNVVLLVKKLVMLVHNKPTPCYQYIADTWLQVLIIINKLAQKFQAIPSHRE